MIQLILIYCRSVSPAPAAGGASDAVADGRADSSSDDDDDDDDDDDEVMSEEDGVEGGGDEGEAFEPSEEESSQASEDEEEVVVEDESEEDEEEPAPRRARRLPLRQSGRRCACGAALCPAVCVWGGVEGGLRHASSRASPMDASVCPPLDLAIAACALQANRGGGR